MDEFIGLLPAAGRGSRLGSIPCSKEIMPLGFSPQLVDGKTAWSPVTAIEMHLRAFQLAGVTRVAIIIGETKNDLLRYIGNGDRYGLSIIYLYQRQLRGMPFALNLATPWIRSEMTLFSMPDTLVIPVDTFSKLAQYHLSHPADITLGLFHTNTPYKFGMVELNEDGDVIGFVDKPKSTTLELMWGIAAWSPRFTHFLDERLKNYSDNSQECVLSDIFLSALQSGLSVQAQICAGAKYHDIGTPEDFQSVVFDLAVQQASAIHGDGEK